jgi:hypothetical protein
MHLSSVTSPFSPALLCFLRLPVGLYGTLTRTDCAFSFTGWRLRKKGDVLLHRQWAVKDVA